MYPLRTLVFVLYNAVYMHQLDASRIYLVLYSGYCHSASLVRRISGKHKKMFQCKKCNIHLYLLKMMELLKYKQI